MTDHTDALRDLRRRLDEAAAYLRVEDLRSALPQLEVEASAPDLWDDAERARTVTGELSQVTADLAAFDRITGLVDDAETLFELGREEGDEATLAEVGGAIAEAAAELSRIELQALFTGEWDDHDAECEIHAGEGGTDSADFAEMLLRMYRRWAERRGFEFEVEAITEGAEAGVSSVSFIVRGRHAYGLLRGEKGTHRLVRISPFNAQGKRQTAFASLSAVPLMEAGEVDIEIPDKDLRIDVYRSSGAGGQHVNKTDSAVRLTHLPTGIVVACQNQRSQHQNKDKAMEILRARLADRERQLRAAEKAAIGGPREMAGFGSRIRSYVLHPYQQVKDERSGIEIGDVNGVLDGDLDPLVEAYLTWERALTKPTS